MKPTVYFAWFYGVLPEFRRQGIYELLLVSDPVKKLILERASADIIRDAGTKQGMRTLRDDGWKKVREGITTVAEVVRVTQEEV